MGHVTQSIRVRTTYKYHVSRGSSLSIHSINRRQEVKIKHTVVLNLETDLNEETMGAQARFTLMSMSEEDRRRTCEEAFLGIMEDKVLNYLNEGNTWAQLKLIKEEV